MDCIVHGVAKSQTRLRNFFPSFHPLCLLSGYLDFQWLSLTAQEDTQDRKLRKGEARNQKEQRSPVPLSDME